MKKLKDFKKSALNINNLFKVNGGGRTSYRRAHGVQGTDTYTDDDGSGNLSQWDTVTLDTGEQMCYNIQ